MSDSQIILDLGCGRRRHAGAIGMDNVFLPTVDLVHDLIDVPYPFASQCADQIILSHVLEHFALIDINTILAEVYRILAEHGVVTVSVPHAFSVAFHTDPTHRTHFTFETLYYFSQEHVLSYYQQLNPIWKVTRMWASVNLVNNKIKRPSRVVQRLEGFASRIMSHLVRHSKSMTLPDLVVKQFPFWLVSIHCHLMKVGAE